MLTPKPNRLFPLTLGVAIALASATGARGSVQQEHQSNTPNQGQANRQGQNGPGNRGFWSDPEFQLNRLRQQVSNIPGGLGGRGGGGGGRGGRGGPGGGNNNNNDGGLGAMLDLLDRSPALQAEIKLKPEQKDKLASIQDQSRQKQRELFQSMRNNGNNNNNNGGGGRGGRGGFNPAMFQQMRQARELIDQQSEVAASKVLTKAQISRLKQIRLQIVGPLAVAEPLVAQSLMLSDEQYQQVQQVIQLMGDRQREMMQTRMQGMRPPFGGGPGGPGGGPGGPGGGPGQQANASQTNGQRNAGQGQATNNGQGNANASNNNQGNANASNNNQGNANASNNNQGNNNNQANNNNQGNNRQGRRGFDPNSPEAQAMQERMKEAMSEEQKLRKEAESAIGKILAPAQRSRFNKMLGAIIDLKKLVENTDQGPGGGRFGGGNNNNNNGGRGGRGNAAGGTGN